MKYQVTGTITVTATFEDDGQHAVIDQAFEAIESIIDVDKNMVWEVNVNPKEIQPVKESP